MPVKSLIELLESMDYIILYTSPSITQHSLNTSFQFKATFIFGYVLWKVSGTFLALGCGIKAQKPT